MLMPPPADPPLRCRLWGRLRFITSCVVSDSMPMSRPLRLTHKVSVTRGNIACSPTRRMRRRCSGRQIQELTSPRTSTIPWGYTRRVSQQTTGNELPQCGDREQPFLRQPLRDKRRHTAPGIPRSPQPTATQQRKARRRVVAVLTDERDRDRKSAPNLDQDDGERELTARTAVSRTLSPRAKSEGLSAAADPSGGPSPPRTAANVGYSSSAHSRRYVEALFGAPLGHGGPPAAPCPQPAPALIGGRSSPASPPVAARPVRRTSRPPRSQGAARTAAATHSPDPEHVIYPNKG